MDVFIYTFEFVGMVNKMVYHLDWWFLKTSFLNRKVQRHIDTILVPHTTLLTDTFGWMRLCAVENFVRMLGKPQAVPELYSKVVPFVVIFSNYFLG